MNQTQKVKRSAAGYFIIGFKGFCMGVADVIPGVSGGTIAFIFGIYEELILAIKSFDLELFKKLLGGRFKEALGQVPWMFLGALISGILLAIFSMSGILTWLLKNKPVETHAFFFGLMLATVPVIGRAVKKWDAVKLAMIALMALVMYYFVGMLPVSTPTAYWFLFLSGAVAICAMILPGISGAFILVILGKYQYIIEAVHNRDFAVLIVVALGCAAGILSFVRVLSWLLTRYHDLTLAALTGLVMGSLRKIWPWKETQTALTTSSGKLIPLQEINYLPETFSAQVGWAMIVCALGFLFAMFISNQSPDGINLQEKGNTS